jgi:hypothetical protein
MQFYHLQWASIQHVTGNRIIAVVPPEVLMLMLLPFLPVQAARPRWRTRA